MRWFIIAGAAILIALIIVLFIVLRPSLLLAEEGTVQFGVDLDGIVIRSEKLYQMDVNGKVELTAEEGQKVSAGDEVVSVYSSDYSESVVAELKSCQEKIFDYLRNNLLKGVQNKELQDLDDQIASLTEKIQSQVKGESSDNLITLERELKNLMDERLRFLREQVNVDAELQKYYEEEAALQARVDGWIMSNVAESDGIVSFYFDGAETMLTTDNMTKLSKKDINNILEGKSYYTLTNSSSARPLYRLVDEYKWYVVVVSPKKIDEFENDLAFNVTFAGAKEPVYTAKVIDSKEDSGEYIYYLSFNQSIEALLLARNVEMRVYADYVGIKVPNSAVVSQGGEQGVYVRNEKKQKVFIPVDVLITAGDYSIIQSSDVTSPIAEGSEIYI